MFDIVLARSESRCALLMGEVGVGLGAVALLVEGCGDCCLEGEECRLGSLCGLTVVLGMFFKQSSANLLSLSAVCMSCVRIVGSSVFSPAALYSDTRAMIREYFVWGSESVSFAVCLGVLRAGDTGGGVGVCWGLSVWLF